MASPFRALAALVSRARKTATNALAGPAGRVTTWSRPRAGVRVDEASALTYSAVFACVRIVSEAVACLPFHAFRRRPDGGTVAEPGLPVDGLISRRFSSEMSSFDGLRIMTAHALAWGNGYAEIERDGAGRAVNLWPITPDRVTIGRDDAGRVVYMVKPEPDAPAESAVPLDARRMLHLHGLGFDGLAGYSVVHLAREAISLGLGLERFGASYFGNGSRTSGFLRHPGKLNKEQGAELLEMWAAETTGAANWQRPGLLRNGLEWVPNSIPNEDAQFLESRRWQLTDIARWFRVPNHLLNDIERADISVAQQGIEFVTYTLMPWLRSWETEVNFKLFGPQFRADHFARFNVNALLRADPAARADFYRVMGPGVLGVLTLNDIRGLEDLNPIGPDGDVHMVQVNMTTLARAIEGAEPAPASSDAIADTDDPAAPPAAPAPAGTDDGDRSERIAAAASELAAGQIRRLVAKETNAARRAHAKGVDKFAAWRADFYDPAGEFAGQVRSTLTACAASMLEVLAGARGAEVSPDLETAARSHVGDIGRAYLEAGAAELAAADAADLAGLLDLWSVTRAEQVSSDLARVVVAMSRGVPKND